MKSDYMWPLIFSLKSLVLATRTHILRRDVPWVRNVATESLNIALGGGLLICNLSKIPNDASYPINSPSQYCKWLFVIFINLDMASKNSIKSR